jgi:hypothetical protein
MKGGDRLSKQYFRVASNDELPDLTDDFIAKPLVEPQGIGIELGKAHEYVGTVAGDSLFGKFYQPGAPPVSPFGLYSNGLYVTGKGPVHSEYKKPGDLAFNTGYIGLSPRVSHHLHRVLVRTLEGYLWFRVHHYARAVLDLHFAVNGPDHDVLV